MVAEPVFDYRGEYDENWPLPERLTLEQYRRVFFRPDAHFVDGRIVQRNLGDRVHSDTLGALIAAIAAQTNSSKLAKCISLRLQTSPTRIRVCDFVVLASQLPYEPVPTYPPLLCIEVLSQDQQPEEELQSLADYLAMGVPNIWLIDGSHRKLYTYGASGLQAVTSKQLAIQGTSIHFDLSAFYSLLTIH